MHSMYVDGEVRRVLIAWLQVQRELTQARPSSELLALHVQGEVLAGKLRRVRGELRRALELLEVFDPLGAFTPTDVGVRHSTPRLLQYHSDVRQRAALHEALGQIIDSVRGDHAA